MKTQQMVSVLSLVALVCCGDANPNTLDFEVTGAITESVHASGTGDAIDEGGWINAGGWDLVVDVPHGGGPIDASHGSFHLAKGGVSFSVEHGGTCTVDLASHSPLAGDFSCTGLTNASGDVIDASGHFSIAAPQRTPCSGGFPDLYCH